MDKAIIGGTGVYDIGGDSCTSIVETAYGSVEVDIANIDGEEIAFLARHGKGHSTPPHRINFRANMAALKQLGVKYIYATAAVGSCNENYAPGDIVILKDFIDMTKVRPLTFFEGEDGSVMHTDMSDPYCKSLRSRFGEAAKELKIHVKGGDSVYICTEGPRFETASEIKVFKKLGGDIVGMTNVPEVILAKELGMCYAAVGIVTNWCTGMNNEGITLHDIQGSLSENKEKITKVFLKVFQGCLSQENCMCKEAIIKL
jgi:5'-methylthioadenosine phosphorylase